MELKTDDLHLHRDEDGELFLQFGPYAIVSVAAIASERPPITKKAIMDWAESQTPK